MKIYVNSESRIQSICLVSPSPSLFSAFLFHSHSCFSSTFLQLPLILCSLDPLICLPHCCQSDLYKMPFDHVTSWCSNLKWFSRLSWCSSQFMAEHPKPFTFRPQTCFQPHLRPLLHLFSPLPQTASFSWSTWGFLITLHLLTYYYLFLEFIFPSHAHPASFQEVFPDEHDFKTHISFLCFCFFFCIQLWWQLAIHSPNIY